MRNFFYFLTFIILVGIVVMAYRFKMVRSDAGQVFCAQDVRMCLDGTYVGRGGPRCDFAACPNYVSLTFTDAKQGLSYDYPKLETKYISPVKWPPGVTMQSGTFRCFEGGSEIELSGRTEERKINGRTYCIKIESNGAAGSVYSSFTYTTGSEADRIVIGSTTLRFVQCGNYDEPRRIECEKERSVFSMDQIMDMVLGSIRILTTSTRSYESSP